MLAAADAFTLAEDWLARRQRLAGSVTIPEAYRQAQLQVLEYLIRRYGDSPEAARPARFGSSAPFYSNDRVIVVHHHLGRGTIAGVKSQAEANQRVGDILRHLQSVHENDIDDIAAHNDFADWVDELDEHPIVPERAWNAILRALRRRRSAHRAIAEALQQSPYLPRAALTYLCRCLSRGTYDMEAAEMLLSCRSEKVPEYVARAWRERVDRGCLNAVTEKLRDYLAAEPRALDGVRERLGDRNPAIRLAATEVLRDAGTLDDVSLLSDLVSLPADESEHADERRALLDAMWAIAHR
ncbi:MAG TPA: hypothetical protein VHC22_20420 [Pirellulales bacterium]|nr:hypothetical protein [Pirellulales bacterium]